jgi:solute carrier family 25 (adenine nucleotide translocator) protein 4/5/6/31
MDAKSGGNRQFNGIIDCYVKTFRSDGIRGLYRGFVVSCTCIFIYRGLYFGLFDSLQPILLGKIFIKEFLQWQVFISWRH